MREAVGGSLLLYLIIPIIIVFIVFIGFIMRYASAYRAANFIVTQIESCQGYTDCASNWNTAANRKVISSKYRYQGSYTITCSKVDDVPNAVVHDVELEVEFDLPLLGTLPAFSVKAQTKSMHNSKCTSTQRGTIK